MKNFTNPKDAWILNKKDTTEYALHFEDPNEQWKATAKWDGCIHLFKYDNGFQTENPDDIDYLHICDLDSFIDRLQALKKVIAEKGFKHG